MAYGLKAYSCHPSVARLISLELARFTSYDKLHQHFVRQAHCNFVDIRGEIRLVCELNAVISVTKAHRIVHSSEDSAFKVVSSSDYDRCVQNLLLTIYEFVILPKLYERRISVGLVEYYTMT